ncbi:MAG TPA: hypothetical protein VNL14_02060 [Candidatus Acidoferrales bacterium]|nr:hypothetical protein [Candidatus Acidoferrales bacterium]
MRGALEPYELGYVFQVLAEDVLIALREHGHGRNAEPQQPFARPEIVDDVDGGEVDAFLRKELFRSKATASAGLREEDELLAGGFHGPTERDAINAGYACQGAPKGPALSDAESRSAPIAVLFLRELNQQTRAWSAA